jgi:hypothetical protein
MSLNLLHHWVFVSENGQMSRGNIVNVAPEGEDAVRVTFETRQGELWTYRFVGPSAYAILAGADPKNYLGERIE